MAVNRFSRPIDSQFINTYVPIPFEQMMQAGAMKQQRYDQNSAAMDASVARAEDINAIPNSIDARERDAALGRIHDIRDKFYGKDLSDSMVVRQLNNEIRKAVSPSDIKKWEGSFAGWQNYKKNEAVMTSKGQQVYNPTDFANYDSSTTGVFSGLPTMDLGALPQKEMSDFLSKPEMKYKRVEDEYGAIGTEHYRDVNEIYALIENEKEFSQLAGSPAMQQFMEKNQMKVADLKDHLRGMAPSFVKTTGTGFSFPPGSGKANEYVDPYGGVYRTPGAGGVENYTATEVKRGLEQDVATLVAGETLLTNMEKDGSGYTEEEVERQRASNEQQRNLNTAKKTKIDNTLTQVEADFADPIEAVYDKYMGLLVSEENLSKKQARRVLERGLVTGEEEEKVRLTEDDEADTAERITRNTGQALGGAGRAMLDPFEGIGRKMRGGTMGLIENFNDEMQGLRLDQKKAEKVALSEAFSQTNTADLMLVSQRKKSNGYVEVEDQNGDFHQSHIYNQVTSQITGHPEEFVVKSSNSTINDNMNEYLNNVKMSKEWNLDLRGASSVVDKDGAVTLFYDLTGPKDKESGSIQVTISDPFQIENIVKDYITQGDPIAAARMSYGWLMPQAIQNAGVEDTSYGIYRQNLDPTTMSSKPVIRDKVEVHFDDVKGIYTVKVRNAKGVMEKVDNGTINTENALGNALIEIQMMALGQDPRKG